MARRLPPGVADLPAPDRRELARLLLLCAAPASARSAAAVAAVGALLGDPAPVAPPSGAGAATAPPATATAVATGPDREPGGMEGADPARDATGWAPEDADRADRPHVPPAGSPPPPGPEREVAGDPDAGGQVGGPPPPAVSPAAGMLFLVAATGTPQLRAATPPPLPGTGPLADRPLSTVVAQLAARLGEVGPDDPAVHVLAGQPREPLPEPTPDEEAALGVLAEDVRAWLRALLRLEPDDDLRWLWHRPARIAAEPGWVEATFSLDDVDTRVRAAGLDLDPGFVWWLGSVVRYRYA